MPECMMVRDQGGAPELRSERIQVLFEEGLFGMRNSVSERLSDLPKVTHLEKSMSCWWSLLAPGMQGTQVASCKLN